MSAGVKWGFILVGLAIVGMVIYGVTNATRDCQDKGGELANTTTGYKCMKEVP